MKAARPLLIWSAVATSAVGVTVSACESRSALSSREPSGRERSFGLPAANTSESHRAPKVDAVLEQAIAADRQNEFRALQRFLAFARQARREPGKAAGIADCTEPHPGQGASLCTKIHTERASGDTWFVSYAEAESEAFRLQAVLGNIRLNCRELGDANLMRSWRFGSAEKRRCAISGGPLAGLEALLENYPGNANVFLFNAAYLAHDEAFRALLETETDAL